MELEGLKTIRGILAFICIILALAVMKMCSSILIPLAIAIFIFILINPFLERMDSFHIPKMISTVVTLVIVAAICIIFVYLLISMVNMLLVKFPEYVNRISIFDAFISSEIRRAFNLDVTEFPSVLSMLNIDWYGQVKNLLSTVSSMSASILGDVAMILLYLLFLLTERFTLQPKIEAAFPRGERFSEIFSSIGNQTSRYLSIKVMISAVTGILFYITALFSKMDFPLVWGISAFLLNFIPTIGSIVVTVVATFFALIQFMPNWGYVVLLFFIFLLIEMVLGNIVDPKIQGVQLNLSPLVILVMLTLWGYVWGITGMFLAVPITSIMQVVCLSIPSLKPVAIILSTGTIYSKKEEPENIIIKHDENDE